MRKLSQIKLENATKDAIDNANTKLDNEQWEMYLEEILEYIENAKEDRQWEKAVRRYLQNYQV